jgi:TATA-box binding protein (TBP) (component of TFIID and TFIIIB)
MIFCEDIKINNICASFTLNTKLYRKTILSYFPTIRYPARFSGGILKYPDGCLLVFDSGKINVTGVKSLLDAYTLIERFCIIYPCTLYKTELKIANIVAHTRLSNDFDYRKLQHFPYYSYEAELFPGTHVKVDKSKAIFIVFRTGRITVTGLRTLSSVETYFKEFAKVYQSINLYKDNMISVKE